MGEEVWFAGSKRGAPIRGPMRQKGGDTLSRYAVAVQPLTCGMAGSDAVGWQKGAPDGSLPPKTPHQWQW